jgi:hypothetical protein
MIMDYNLYLIDFLKIDEKLLLKKNSNLAFYTGINAHDIPLNFSFNCLYDSKNIETKILGNFTIKYIEVLQKPSNKISSGYNAIIYVSSSVKTEYIKEFLDFDKKGNIKNVCIFTNVSIVHPPDATSMSKASFKN